MLHNDEQGNLKWYQKPMLWRLLFAIAILGYGHKIFGDEPSKKSGESEKNEWSMVIAPANSESSATITTFTLDKKTGKDLKQETQDYIELVAPEVLIIPEEAVVFPKGEPLSSTTKSQENNSNDPCTDCRKTGIKYSREDYVRVYNSIPFSRSLYNANPTYRHDATMEILLGQPKPVTIVKKEVTQHVVAPYSNGLYPYYDPWYLTHGYPNLRTTPVYSTWRPYQPYYTGAWGYHHHPFVFGHYLR